MIPDPDVGPKEELAEKAKLTSLKKILNEEEKRSIIKEASLLKSHQEKL